MKSILAILSLVTRHSSPSKNFAGSLISTYRKKNAIRDSLHCYIGFSASTLSASTNHATLRLRFILRSFLSSVCRSAKAKRLNRKVKDQAERVISTPELNTLLCLHPEPINVVVYHDPSGRSHLGIGLALRCFQRLSFPNIATQRCR